MISFITCHC
uniref:Uncharacterized protein n=1 Tax=Arundo donax TaxID=35708 RepID=A0A0A8Y7I2_ARUDO